MHCHYRTNHAGLYIQNSENNHHFTNHHLVWASIQRGGSGLGFESASEVLLLIKNISIGPVDYQLNYRPQL